MIVCDSTDRDCTLYPNSAEFAVGLDQRYGISVRLENPLATGGRKLKLVDVIIPKPSFSDRVFYLEILDVRRSTYHSSFQGNTVFPLIFRQDDMISPSALFASLKRESSILLEEPLRDRLSFRILREDGSLLNYPLSSIEITSCTCLVGTCTVTTVINHGLATGDTVALNIPELTQSSLREIVINVISPTSFSFSTSLVGTTNVGFVLPKKWQVLLMFEIS